MQVEIKESFKAIDSGQDFIIAQLKALGDGAEVTTGIQAEEAGKMRTYRRRRFGKVPVGVYARYIEYGTKNMKARPFMKVTLDSTVEEYTRQTAAGMQAIYRQGLTLQQLLDRQAKRTRTSMRKTIKTWSNPATSEATMQRKRQLKLQTKNLLETGTMFRSIKSKTKRYRGGLNKDLRKLINASEAILKRKGQGRKR